jgi:hypothetical protein
MADEPWVDQGDALGGGDRAEQTPGLLGAGRGPDIEAQRPQIAVEGRSGYRRTGEDGGRQTNSLLGTDSRGARRHGPAIREAARRQRLSDEQKDEFTARLLSGRHGPAEEPPL